MVQPKTLENAMAIARQEEIEAQAQELARKANEEHAELRLQKQRDAETRAPEPPAPSAPTEEEEPFVIDPHPSPHAPNQPDRIAPG